MLGLGNSLVLGGVPEWAPDNISSLLHWYKNKTDVKLANPFTDVSQSIAYDDVVASWQDQKSGNLLTGHTTDEDAAPRYVENSGAVIFDDANDVLTFNSGLSLGTFSIYFRAKATVSSGNQWSNTFLMETNGADFIKTQSKTQLKVKIDGTIHQFNFAEGATPALVDDTIYTIGVERTDSSDTTNDVISVYTDLASSGEAGIGEASSGGTQDISTAITLNRFGQPAGDTNENITFYEILIFNKALSEGDRELLFTYLNDKIPQ